MSLWDSIGSMFKSKPSSVARDAGRVYILDGERVLEGRGGEKIGPLDRFQLLQRISGFAEREQIRLNVVFAGRPLREVAHGGTYNGVNVYFAEQASGVIDQIDKLVRQNGRNVVVISADSATEAKVASRGASNLRIGTLRKALENGGGERGDGDDQNRHRPRRMRPRGGDRDRRREGPREPREQRDQRPDAQQSQDSDQGSSGSNDPGNETTVKNLIDLVE